MSKYDHTAVESLKKTKTRKCTENENICNTNTKNGLEFTNDYDTF